MAIIMTANDFIARAKQAASSKTLYVMGGFGAPLNATNKQKYIDLYPYNRKPAVKQSILNATNDTFGFDCVNLLKGILWGWCGDPAQIYGGAVYASNGVPDTNEKGLFQMCKDQTVSFKNIQPGEMLYMTGHAGIYIGDGLAIESTPAWQNKVQISAVTNIGLKAQYPGRQWEAHGKLPWINYSNQPTPAPVPSGITFSFSQIMEGSEGDDVMLLQTILRGLGLKGKDKKALTIDGEFGPNTSYALRSFQESHAIEVDGIAGPVTWGRLLYKE